MNADDLAQLFEQTALGTAGRLRFGMAPMPSRAILTPALEALLSDATGISTDVSVQETDGLWKLLIAGEIEFFVALEGQVPDAPLLDYETIGTCPVRLIVRKTHPLVTCKTATGSFPLLTLNRRGVGFQSEHTGIKYSSTHIIENIDILVRLATTTDGILVSSSFAVMAELAAGALVELPVSAALRLPNAKMVVHSLARRSRSAARLAIVDRLRAECRNLEAQYSALHAIASHRELP